MSPAPATAVAVVDLLDRAHGGTDLAANLMSFDPGEGSAAHVNAAVDVLLVSVAGTGIVPSDGVAHELAPGRAPVIPKGTRRAITPEGGRLTYLGRHRGRAPLRPVRAWPTADDPAR